MPCNGAPFRKYRNYKRTLFSILWPLFLYKQRSLLKKSRTVVSVSAAKKRISGNPMYVSSIVSNWSMFSHVILCYVIYMCRSPNVPKMIKYRQIILIEGCVLWQCNCLWGSVNCGGLEFHWFRNTITVCTGKPFISIRFYLNLVFISIHSLLYYKCIH